MGPIPRPLLGLFLLANSLLLSPVQGAPFEVHVPFSWNSTAPGNTTIGGNSTIPCNSTIPGNSTAGNSSNPMHRPPRPWAPAPFFWNASPPRPYHSYGYSDFYKSKTDEAQDESGTTIKQGPEVEDVPDESEAEAEDVSSDIEESDEDSDDLTPERHSFWDFFGRARHADAEPLSRPAPEADDGEEED